MLHSKGFGECLEDEPGQVDDYEYPDLPAGAMYNAEHQCQLQFGQNVQVCSQSKEICSRLWCYVNETCKTQLRPAAPGTHCGKHMVIYDFFLNNNRVHVPPTLI